VQKSGHPPEPRSDFRATVQHATLLRVCELLGGISSAARSLNVATLQVANWLDGDDAIPEDVFHSAVRILIEHSRFR
jgi:hypothetical protein